MPSFFRSGHRSSTLFASLQAGASNVSYHTSCQSWFHGPWPHSVSCRKDNEKEPFFISHTTFNWNFPGATSVLPAAAGQQPHSASMHAPDFGSAALNLRRRRRSSTSVTTFIISLSYKASADMLPLLQPAPSGLRPHVMKRLPEQMPRFVKNWLSLHPSIDIHFFHDKQL